MTKNKRKKPIRYPKKGDVWYWAAAYHNSNIRDWICLVTSECSDINSRFGRGKGTYRFDEHSFYNLIANNCFKQELKAKRLIYLGKL